MAKKNEVAEKEQNPKNSNNLKFKIKIKINTKTKETHTTTNGDAVSSPEHPSNDSVAESSMGKEVNGVKKGVSDVDKEKKKRKSKSEIEDLENNNNYNNNNNNSNNKRRNKRKKDEVEDEENDLLEEKSESGVGYIPMNRISRIVRSENPDVKISQEAIFLVNRATEKFLQLFSKEAYDCAFRDRKKSVAYNHLSSVVSSQSRYEFLLDFVPEKVKAGDALAQIETDIDKHQ